MPSIFGQVNNLFPGKKSYVGGLGAVQSDMEKVAATDPNSIIVSISTNTSWSDEPKHNDDVHFITEEKKRPGIAVAAKITKHSNATLPPVIKRK